jgi:hypothetical protein
MNDEKAMAACGRYAAIAARGLAALRPFVIRHCRLIRHSAFVIRHLLPASLM